MDAYVLILFFIFGAIIGSFLNVVLYRMHTGRSFAGRSHCLSCAEPLAWYELFPVFSYLALAGRCRHCGAYVPARYLIIELLTGLAFVSAWLYFGDDIVLLVLNVALFTFLILILVYDMRHTIIPDEFVVGITVAAILMFFYRTLGAAEAVLFPSAAGVVGAGMFFGGLWYISKGRWLGLGDAKLAMPLALLVGAVGTFSMIVLAFWIGAVVSVFLLALRRLAGGGQNRLRFLPLPRTIKSEVPFAPFLIAGFLLSYLYNVDIFLLTYAILFA